MIRRNVVGLILAIVLLCGTVVGAQDADLTAAKTLYREQCGKCHGILSPDTRSQRNTWGTSFIAVATPLQDARRSDVRSRVSRRVAAVSWQVAVAMPYGPSLRGIYGRPAGSVAGFSYSRAFKRMLQGVIWSSHTLDEWITDSQKRAPGSRMFYEQPDPEIRRQIIAYLYANR